MKGFSGAETLCGQAIEQNLLKKQITFHIRFLINC